MLTRSVPVAGIDLASTLGTLAFLPGDPTVRLAPGRLERATVTPDGVGTIVVTWAPRAPAARAEAHGPGGSWLLERAPRLLGGTDDTSGFAPTAEPLRSLWRRHGGDRIPRTGTLWHDCAWFVVQQRVTREDAADHWRRLVRGLGTPAPGAAPLMAPPEPAAVARLGYAQLHAYGIERRRADTLRAAARAVLRLQDRVDGEAAGVLPALRSVPGIGAWTTTCVATQTWGDPDTVIAGDHGIPSLVAWVLAGEPRADDARMLELLEPYRPHRHRVVRLAFASGSKPPRRHPRGRRTDIRRR